MPLIYGLSSCFALFALYIAWVALILQRGGQPFIYPLDDTYIHMDVARTLATSGVWGVTPTDPAAASSSPLWTLLLAGSYAPLPGSYFIYMPLLLNVLAGGALIWVLLKIFRPQPVSVVLATAVCFACALPSLSVLGMEHVLHATLAIALCFYCCRIISIPENNARIIRAIGLLAALCVMTRYESLFLLAPLALMAAVRRRWSIVMALCGGATLPILAFGLLWIHNGGWLLPNSLLVKAGLADAEAKNTLLLMARHGLERMLTNTYQASDKGGFIMMAILLLCMFLVQLRLRRGWDVPAMFAACALATTVGHLAFANVGWLYRYEAWLIAMDTTAIFLLAESRLPDQRSLLSFTAIILFLFMSRTLAATCDTIWSMEDRRMEHVPQGEFVDRYYSGSAVMVNDLGIIAFMAPHTRVLDIYGLGNNEPVRLMLAKGRNGFGAAQLEDWSVRTGTRIAVIKVCWPEIMNRIPDDWQLVALWHFPRNIVFGDHLIGFFAATHEERETLLQHLKEFPVPYGMTVTLEPPRSELKKLCAQGT